MTSTAPEREPRGRGVDGRIERPVDADRLQQPVAGIGREALPRQRGLGMRALIDDPLPARKRPRRRAEMQAGRQDRDVGQRAVLGAGDAAGIAPMRRNRRSQAITAEQINAAHGLPA